MPDKKDIEPGATCGDQTGVRGVDGGVGCSGCGGGAATACMMSGTEAKRAYRGGGLLGTAGAIRGTPIDCLS